MVLCLEDDVKELGVKLNYYNIKLKINTDFLNDRTNYFCSSNTVNTDI